MEIVLALLASLAWSQSGTIGIDRFGGLEDANLPAVISSHRAQDALNVESSLDGRSLKKRGGYSQEAALTVSTSSVTGITWFVDSSGNNLRIACHDVYCAQSTNGGAFSNFLTTATRTTARWSFVNDNGRVYGANNSRDRVFRYDGTTLDYPSGIPRGSILEATEDRLVVADTSANPNRVNYSKSGDFITFTVGSASADPWTDDIGTAGDKITGLKYSHGRLYIFKQGSVTSCIYGDQYTTVCFPISNSIGTTDPASIVESPDGVYFRSQDRSYWRISGGNLDPISLDISSTTKSQTSGSNQSNTQTTQADWEAGSQNPSASFNTTTRFGSIFNSSITLVDTSSTNFANGTLTNVSTIPVNGSLFFIQSASASFINSGAETNGTTNWTFVDGGSNCGEFIRKSSSALLGSWMWMSGQTNNNNASGGTCDESAIFSILDSDNKTVYSIEKTITNDLPSTAFSINTSSFALSSIKIEVETTIGGCPRARMRSSAFVRGDTVGFYYFDPCVAGGVCNQDATSCGFAFDVDSNIKTTGNIVSRTFDSTFSTPTWGTFSASFSSSSNHQISFETQSSTASDGGGFESLVSQSLDGKGASAQRRYVRYKASFSLASTTNTTGQLDSVSLVASTTGQFRTQCIQPGSGISSWGIFSCAESLVGAGSHVYYSTSAATCSALPSTDPSNWTTSTNNATLTISTNVAMYLGWRSLLGSATDQAQVDACTVYWNVGTLAQPVFGVYDTITNSIFWTSGVNNSATSNRVFKYDLNLREWFPWGLSFGPLLMYQNSLYAGDSGAGRIYKYGGAGVTSDNGSNISAYWTSKDFPGLDPFRETSWQRIHLLAKNQITGNMTLGFTTSLNQTGSYTVSLATVSALGYSRTTYSIPIKSPSNFLNVKFSNNSATPFEILGFKIDYFTNPWFPTNP